MAESSVVLLDHQDLRRYEIAILEGLGVPLDQAEIVVDNLVEADLRGVDSHGAHLVELYVARLRSGHLRPVTEGDGDSRRRRHSDARRGASALDR